MKRLTLALVLLSCWTLLLGGCAPRTAPPPPAPESPQPVTAAAPPPQLTTPPVAPPVTPAPVAPAPPEKPGVAIWAVDPQGARPAELLYSRPRAANDFTTLCGATPDGRYAVLIKQLGDYKGDYRTIPYLLDLQTGELKTGNQTEIRPPCDWSGRGWWVQTMAHMDAAFHVDKFEPLRKALGVAGDERSIIAASFTGDGKRAAVLVGHAWWDQPLDLFLADSDGRNLVKLATGIHGWQTQMGNIANLAMAPDGSRLLLSAREPGTVLIDLTKPDPAGWIQLLPSRDPLGGDFRWAPDSAHLFVPSLGVVDRAGKLVLEARIFGGTLWRPDGGAILLPGPPAQLVDLKSGHGPTFTFPQNGFARSFLPDGRILTGSITLP